MTDVSGALDDLAVDEMAVEGAIDKKNNEEINEELGWKGARHEMTGLFITHSPSAGHEKKKSSIASGQNAQSLSDYHDDSLIG